MQEINNFINSATLTDRKKKKNKGIELDQANKNTFECDNRFLLSPVNSSTTLQGQEALTAHGWFPCGLRKEACALSSPAKTNRQRQEADTRQLPSLHQCHSGGLTNQTAACCQIRC